MKKFNNKIVVLAAFAALTIAITQAASFLSGYLSPNHYDSYSGTFTSGWMTVDIDGSGYGDLDIKVYDENGYLLAEDTEPDNNPYVRVYNPRYQRIQIVVENADESYSASYTGEVR